ncbi:hypothetical protein [uncultured archaeal virus]|uniref:Uncharacterized protein n=1 Tax=uncultured archaeal virus TaxID=1960247 RepID=A0A8B0LN87_9VIRU|nr:hypothetical protein [uncultured archaeal virus]
MFGRANFLPKHQNKKDLLWKDIDDFVNFYFLNQKISKSYEFELYNPRWFNSTKAWQISCAKKIDLVVNRNDEIYIFETDPQILDETIGQLLTYRFWYEKQEQKKVKKMIALCGEIQEQTAEVALLYGIEVWKTNFPSGYTQYVSMY